jgi:hypothetical protein
MISYLPNFLSQATVFCMPVLSGCMSMYSSKQFQYQSTLISHTYFIVAQVTLVTKPFPKLTRRSQKATWNHWLLPPPPRKGETNWKGGGGCEKHYKCAVQFAPSEMHQFPRYLNSSVLLRYDTQVTKELQQQQPTVQIRNNGVCSVTPVDLV